MTRTASAKTKTRKPKRTAVADHAFPLPIFLDICWGCRYHVRPNTKTCPFCGADIAIMWKLRRAELAIVEAYKIRLQSILTRVRKAAQPKR